MSDPRPTTLTGWGRTAPSVATVRAVRTVPDAAAAVAAAPPRGVIARGLGRSYNDAAQSAGGTVLDLTGLDEVTAFDHVAGRITAGAGLSLGRLLGHVLPAGWCVPVLPGTRAVTLGGALAADVHGKDHHVRGSFADHVASFDLLAADGEVQRVDRDRAPRLFAATAGGMGLTGVVTAVTLRLVRVETAWVRVETARAADLDEVLAQLAAARDDAPSSVAWLDLTGPPGRPLRRGPHARAVPAGRLGRGVVSRAWPATAAEVASLASPPADPLADAPRTRLRVPRGLPSGLLRPTAVAALNEARYRAAPTAPRQRLEHLSTYTHPLDGVADWNRVYGPAGLVQYQFVVPAGAEPALRRAVERLAGAPVPVTLAVLKRFGPGNDGMLSFPLAGWTLAVDLPNGPGVRELLDRLDEDVLAAGGRVYLAKDARLPARHLPAMYPRLEAFREVRREVDPDGRLTSDLARRLGL